MELRTVLVGACLMTAFATLPTAAADTGEEIDYIGGTSDMGQAPIGTGVALCQDDDLGTPGVGGACSVSIPDTAATTVTVDDDVQEDVAFSWTADDANGDRCDEGTGQSGDTLTINEECVTISIFLELGATQGTIHIA